MTSPRTAAQVGSPSQADGVVTGQAALDELVALLDLEQLELNLFRGVSPPHSPTRVFGGQVAGQALVAAGRTVRAGPGRALAALVLPAAGRPAGADRLRRRAGPRRPVVHHPAGAGGAARRGHLHPGGVVPAAAARGRARRARAVRGPGARGPARPGRVAARRARRFLSGVPRPLDLRFVEAPLWTSRRGPATDEPQRVWMRADGTLPDDPLLHVCLLTYASDLTLLASVLAPHPMPMRPGRAGEPGPRDVVPPPVPRRRVAALRVPLAERLGVTRARDGPVLHARRPAGGDGGAGGDGAGPGRR